MSDSNANNAPICKWYRWVMGCGTVRQRLYLDGNETPYFVDTAASSPHRTYGEKHGLYGSGMGPRPMGCDYQIAGVLGFGPKLEPLKAKAEQMALSRLEMA